MFSSVWEQSGLHEVFVVVQEVDVAEGCMGVFQSRQACMAVEGSDGGLGLEAVPLGKGVGGHCAQGTV